MKDAAEKRGLTLSAGSPTVVAMDMKLELIMVPVTDVDGAKAFYEKVGFDVDHDHTVSDEIRFVQLTPPGSACSIAVGRGITEMAPGSLDNLQMVVADADATHADLVERGVEVRRARTRPGAGSCASPTRTATGGRCSSSPTGRPARRRDSGAVRGMP